MIDAAQPHGPSGHSSTGLRLLTASRADKSADRATGLDRLQSQLFEYFPALEKALDYSRSKAALMQLSKHRTPDGMNTPRDWWRSPRTLTFC